MRADGFHGLTTLYQTLGVHDVVTVWARRARVTRITIKTDHSRVPVDGRNTAWQMSERALRAMGVTAEVEIQIEKRLPVQGGMGAGSANAAAALMGMERELAGWREPGPELGGAERMRIAGEVGSDVPLFLVGGAVLGTGRGEEVTAMPDVTVGDGRGVACVVALPTAGVPTPFAFREWDARRAGKPGLTSAVAPATLDKLSLAYSSAYRDSAVGGFEPGTSGIVGGRSPEGSPASEQGGAYDDLAGNTLLALVRTGIENDFEEVVFPYHPSLRETKRLLMGEDSSEPAVYAALSGSGSALFGLYRSEAGARAAQQRIRSSGTEAILTETLTRAEYWSRVFADRI